ncbi:MAG: hypothetical protein GWN13_12075, partial [Phycisphaerae bacterium]|nr:hypothetical protein [Phycisphaerae bacterium]
MKIIAIRRLEDASGPGWPSPHPDDCAPDKDCPENSGIIQGPLDVFFHQPEIMYDSGKGRHVDDAMELDPLGKFDAFP